MFAVSTCLILIFQFLCTFGDMCYNAALLVNVESDLWIRIIFCICYAIAIILAVICICSMYNKKKYYRISAIFNIIPPVFYAACYILPFIGQWNWGIPDFFDWIILIFSPIVSLLNFIAFRREK